MSPAAHALDRRLQALRTAHETVTANLQDLESERTYVQMVTGEGIAGTTASRAAPAVAQVADIWHGLDLLGQLIEHVGGQRGVGPLDERHATQLFAMLNSASLVFPEAPRTPRHLVAASSRSASSAPPVPVRPLVTGPTTPHALIGSMDDCFRGLRSLVAEVENARRQLPERIEQVTAHADRLAEELPGFRKVGAARDALAALPGLVPGDPLGAAEELRRVEHALAAAADARADVARLGRIVATAVAKVEEIEPLVREGRGGLTRSRVEIAEPEGLLDPVDPEVIDGERGLRPWLDRLDRLVAEGEVRLAEKGLASWTALADRTLDAARQVAEANAGPFRRREELRSLVRAARVKAGASGRAEDPHMTELAVQAEQALAVPCCLRTAEAQVGELLEELRRTPTPAQSVRTVPNWKERSA